VLNINFTAGINKHKNKIILFTVLVIQIVFHRFIFLMGDDFYYGTFSNSLDNFFREHISHYLNINGRALVHFIVSVLLIFDVYLWRIINPFIIMLTIWIIYKNTQTNSGLGLIVCALLFFSFNLDIVHAGVYSGLTFNSRCDIMVK